MRIKTSVSLPEEVVDEENARDLEIINRRADFLNEEANDVLGYQVPLLGGAKHFGAGCGRRARMNDEKILLTARREYEMSTCSHCSPVLHDDYRMGFQKGPSQSPKAQSVFCRSSDSTPRSYERHRPRPRSFDRSRTIYHVRDVIRGASVGHFTYR